MASKLINDNKEYTQVQSEVINSEHVIIYISEKYISNTAQQIQIPYKIIEFYILSSESFNFFRSTFVTIENCDTLIFHIKFRELTDILKLNEITSLFSLIHKINEVKHIELYINSTIEQNTFIDRIIPENISIYNLSLHDDVKYFFSFGKALPMLLNSNLCKLTLKDFKFNRNSQIGMFFNSILNTHCSELYLENIGVEILTKSNDFELTHYIEINEDGIFFVFDNTTVKTEIKIISVINCTLINIKSIEKIIQNKEKSFEIRNINRNSFIIYPMKIESFKEENKGMSISIDNDIENECSSETDKMNIDETFDLTFLNTDRVYKLLKLKNFDDIKACYNLNQIKVKEIHFINDSIDFINLIYSKLDKNVLNHIVLNRITYSNKCLNINSINSLTLKDSYCNCITNTEIKVNNLHLRFNKFHLSSKPNEIIKNILLNNTLQTLIIESESINVIKNSSTNIPIKVSNLIIQNIQGSQSNFSLITEFFKDVQNVSLNNIYYNKKEEIDISIKLSLIQHFFNSIISIDYNTFINLLFHENPICKSAEEFYLLSKELIPEEKKKGEQTKLLDIIYTKAHNNLLKLLSLNKGIIITYSNRKEYLNIIYDIIAFTKELPVVEYLSSITNNSLYGFSNYFISPEILNEFSTTYGNHFKLEKKTS